MTGIEQITAERADQIKKHGYSLMIDKRWTKRQLAKAARALLMKYSFDRIEQKPQDWDSDLWQKMCEKSREKRLILAGALIAAELDRISEDEIKSEQIKKVVSENQSFIYRKRKIEQLLKNAGFRAQAQNQFVKKDVCIHLHEYTDKEIVKKLIEIGKNAQANKIRQALRLEESFIFKNNV